MSAHVTGRHGPWVVISNYPAWPSPYFAEMERRFPHALQLEFAAHPEMLADRPGPPGVVNLHRLKRLYREPGGQRTRAAAQALLRTLGNLRTAGWRIVWTVHNLLPIDGEPPTAADRYVTYRVLDLADAVLTHTNADAAHIRSLTCTPVTIIGWAAPTPAAGRPPAPVRRLARDMASADHAVLVVGNITAYKALPTVVDAFARATRRAELFIVGPSRDADLTREIALRATRTGRVHLSPEWVSPRHVHALYRAADAALCPYRVDGAWEFFARTLYPGSVATALSCNTPVIAPDLPAIREMTGGFPHRLYAPSAGPGPALTAAEDQAAAVPLPDAGEGCAARWRAMGAAYTRLAEAIRTT